MASAASAVDEAVRSVDVDDGLVSLSAQRGLHNGGFGHNAFAINLRRGFDGDRNNRFQETPPHSITVPVRDDYLHHLCCVGISIEHAQLHIAFQPENKCDGVALL